MTTTATALAGLQRALESPTDSLGTWRWTVRRSLVPVRDALVREPHATSDGWLSARHGRTARERAALLNRLGALGPLVIESPDVEDVRGRLRRLLADIDHHLQRRHDLAYDEVELEIGGSE